METIAIPHDIFTERVRREYSFPVVALIREFIQNSRDAGAANVNFTFNPETRVLKVIDDGRGLSPELVKPALFVLGGSIKDPGAIGGMGAAKELCFFAHPKYRIHTLTTEVIGSGPCFELGQAATPFPGFLAEITFAESWNVSLYDIVSAVTAITSRSNLPINVTYNGQAYPAIFRGKDTGISTPVGKVFAVAPKHGEEANNIYVRVRGLLMFGWFISLPTRRHLVIEIDKPSTEVLTQNRDGFRAEFRDVFSKLIDEITTQRSSYGRPPPRVYEISPQQAQATSPVEVPVVSSDCLAARTETALGTETIERRPDSQSSMIVNITTDPTGYRPSRFRRRFHVDLANSRYSAVPKYYHPGHLSGSTLWFLQAWKWALDFVRNANGLTHDFELGITLDSEVGATFSQPYRRLETHAHRDLAVYLINPESEVSTLHRRSIVSRLITIAAHELAHFTHSYHSETFIVLSEQYAATAFTARPAIGACLRQIAHTQL